MADESLSEAITRDLGDYLASVGNAKPLSPDDMGNLRFIADLTRFVGDPNLDHEGEPAGPRECEVGMDHVRHVHTVLERNRGTRAPKVVQTILTNADGSRTPCYAVRLYSACPLGIFFFSSTPFKILFIYLFIYFIFLL
jgi:hypothetical protein